MPLLLSLLPLSPLSLSLFLACDIRRVDPLKLLRIRRTCCIWKSICVHQKAQSKNHIEKHLHLHGNYPSSPSPLTILFPTLHLRWYLHFPSPFCQSTAARSVNEWINGNCKWKQFKLNMAQGEGVVWGWFLAMCLNRNCNRGRKASMGRTHKDEKKRQKEKEERGRGKKIIESTSG